MIKGYKMKLFHGKEAEYEKRHSEIWPEMKAMLRAHGVSNYNIFFDRDTDILFSYVEIADEAEYAKVADEPVNRKWWDYMADLMECKPDNSPVTIELPSVFHMD